MANVFISGGTTVGVPPPPVVEPPAPGVPPPVAPAPRPAPVDALTFTLSRWDLSLTLRGEWKVLGGVEGLDDAPTSLLEERGAGMYGAYAMGVDVPSRDVFLPLALRAGSNESWRASRDFLRELTNPLRGTVRLTVTRPDGYHRYVDGWASVRDVSWDASTWSAAGWQHFGLLLRCVNPWWRRPAAPVIWRQSDPVLWFPWLPVRTTSSQVTGADNAVDFGGDAPTYPEFILRGPFTSVTATHQETGRSWTVTENVGVGESLRVLTDANGVRRVLRDDGSSAFTNLAPPFDLWELPPGVSTVNVTVVGATAATEVELSVEQQWSAA